jgi:hypothetical protein
MSGVADNSAVDGVNDAESGGDWFTNLFYAYLFVVVGSLMAPIGYGAVLFGYPSWYYNNLIDLNLLPVNVKGYKLFFN